MGVPMVVETLWSLPLPSYLISSKGMKGRSMMKEGEEHDEGRGGA